MAKKHTLKWKHVLRTSLIFMLASFSPLTAEQTETWQTDFEKATSEAKKGKKAILLNFTGSDWCMWCIKLHDEVFSKEAFQEYAQDELVLVEVDFPARKELDEATKRQNYDLQEKYRIEGYPTIILVDEEGKEIARTGYRPGGAQAYVQHIKKLLEEKS